MKKQAKIFYEGNSMTDAESNDGDFSMEVLLEIDGIAEVVDALRSTAWEHRPRLASRVAMRLNDIVFGMGVELVRLKRSLNELD